VNLDDSLISGPATILQTRTGKQGVLEAYISYLGADKRLDTWVTQASVGERHELDPRPSSLPGPSQASLAQVGSMIIYPLGDLMR
jgi:hypothetical protein